MGTIELYKRLFIEEINSNMFKKMLFFANNIKNEKLILISQKSLSSLSNENISLLMKAHYFHRDGIQSEAAEELYISKANALAKAQGIVDPETLINPYFIGIIPVAVDTLLEDKNAYEKLQKIKAQLQYNARKNDGQWKKRNRYVKKRDSRNSQQSRPKSDDVKQCGGKSRRQS